MSLKSNKTETAKGDIVTLNDTECKNTLHGSKEDILKADSVEPVKTEVSFEPLIVTDQRDDILIEGDSLINTHQSKPSKEAIPNIQEQENPINIESTTQDESIIVKKIQKSVPQKVTSLVESNNAQLAVNQKVHESKEDILAPNTDVPMKSDVSFEPFIVADKRDDIPIETDKSIIGLKSIPSSNVAKLNIQEKEHLINVESANQEESISASNIQKTIPENVTLEVESNNSQLSVNQRELLEGDSMPVVIKHQEKGIAKECLSTKAPTVISTVDSEEKEIKINSPIESPHPSKGKVSKNLSPKVPKELSSNESGEKEEKISFPVKIPKSIKGISILKRQMENKFEINVSEAKCEDHQPNTEIKERDNTVNDASLEDQPRWTSSEESLPDLDMDTSDISVLNEDLVNKIKDISNEITEKIIPGISVQKVTAHLSTEDQKILKKPEAQVALFNAAKRIHDKPKIIQKQIVKEISLNCQNTETFGTRALLLVNELTSNKNQDVTSFFEPKDFDCSKTRSTLCEILNYAQDLKTKKPQPRINRSKNNEENFMDAIKSLISESNEGKPVNEIIAEKQPKDVENMQCIESQMAMISVVEKLGHEKLTEDVVLDQLNSDRVGMLNIVGTKSLLSVLKEKPYSTEEIMKQFKPDDFQHEKVQERVTKILNVAKAVNQKVEKGTHHARL